MRERLTIIIPTCGRQSLRRALRSVREQELADGDEVLLLTDGPQPAAAEVFGRAGLPGRCLATPATRDFGAAQRNRGLDLAAGNYLLFLDDDDVFAPGALATVRRLLRAAPGCPHLFRMRDAADGRVLWAGRHLALGNVGTPMIVVPNDHRLKRWDSRPGHAYRFLLNNLPLWPAGSLVWCEEVVAVVRPQGADAEPLTLPAGPARRPRSVEQCPYREDVRISGGDETARCGLLRQLSGVDEAEWLVVQRDACEACCDAPPPAPGHLNPVIASLLYQLADDVAERGGVAGCTPGVAADLRDRAERSLAADQPDEGAAPWPKRDLQPCYHLGPELGFRLRATADGHARLPVFECRHPDHGETTADACGRCRDWADRPGRPPALEELLPRPPQRRGPPVRRWAVGVTAAPRRQPTLDHCLDSLARAGWDRPRLFVDAAVTLSARFAELPVTLRDSRLGAWPNYYLAVAELLLRHPDADALLLVQDDVIFYDRHDLRAYLEEVLWPADPPGPVSLYCSQKYTQPGAGWHVLPDRWVWGALAFVFPREAAKRFVLDAAVFEHRWKAGGDGLVNIDNVIGDWAARQGLPVHFPTPSLTQHIGETSTIWEKSRAAGARRADRFAGDEGP